MAMPKYEIRDIPEPLWQKLTARANREGYPLGALFLDLIRDYGNESISPRGDPPLQVYAFLKEPFRLLLSKNPAAIGQSTRERWESLREFIRLEEGTDDSVRLVTMDAVSPAHRAGILNWLERSTVVQVTPVENTNTKKPAVMRIRQDPEVFRIVDARYMQMVRDPAKVLRAGYIGTESWVTFDEAALRSELRATFAFSDAEVNAAINHARAMNP
jgi:hypothetical protein